MRIGFGLPNIGPLGSAESIAKVAQKAEELGYDTLWTIERLLYPEKPQTPYPGTPDGSLPEAYKRCLDPLETLTFAAAHTKKIALGSSILDIPYYHPVMLARRLSTLDVFSGGRLRVGFGLGWSEDEFEATNANRKERGRRADEFLDVLEKIWTTDPVEHRGEFFRIPRSTIRPKPVQKPHPPIYMAAYAPAALKRIAQKAKGWNPVGIPVDGMKQMFESLQEMAKAEGRDPASLELVVRANVEMTERPLGDARMVFTGSREQIRSDVEGCRTIGAHEIIFDPTFDPAAQKLDRWLDLLEQIEKWV